MILLFENSRISGAARLQQIRRRLKKYRVWKVLRFVNFWTMCQVLMLASWIDTRIRIHTPKFDKFLSTFPNASVYPRCKHQNLTHGPKIHKPQHFPNTIFFQTPPYLLEPRGSRNSRIFKQQNHTIINKNILLDALGKKVYIASRRAGVGFCVYAFRNYSFEHPDTLSISCLCFHSAIQAPLINAL
jgi:hypothetical protein